VLNYIGGIICKIIMTFTHVMIILCTIPEQLELVTHMVVFVLHAWNIFDIGCLYISCYFINENTNLKSFLFAPHIHSSMTQIVQQFETWLKQKLPLSSLIKICLLDFLFNCNYHRDVRKGVTMLHVTQSF